MKKSFVKWGGYFSIVSLLISLLFASCTAGTNYVGTSSGGSGDYKITISTDTITNGTVTADKKSAAEGDKVTLTVTPESGYELDTLTVKDADGTAVTVTANSFTMPKSNVTVSASFKAALVTYSVTVGTMTNGSVTASKTTSIAKGSSITLTVTPDAGYELDTLSVKDAGGNDVTVTANAFTMPESDVTISATFKMALVTYSVTIGTIAHASSVTANPMTGISAGSTVTITITPEANYKVETITVKQGSTDVPTNAGTAGTYTFSMPSGDVTVNATLVPLYTITVPAATTPGTVTAKVGGVAATKAASGETVTVEISPNSGYEIETLKKDGSDVTSSISAGAYSFTMGSADVTITAAWKALEEDSCDVGSVVLNNGKFVKKDNTDKLSDAQKSAVVAVIFDATGKKGVGLKQERDIAWATEGAIGHGTKITALICTPSDPYVDGSADSSTFTGTTDGSTSLSVIKALSDYDATKYPAWAWIEGYATTASLTGTYASGWYMPSIKTCYEMSII